MANRRRRPRVVRALSFATTPAALAFGVLAATPSPAATSPCTAVAARAAAPPGVTIGPINNVHPASPDVPTGALPVPADGGTPAYCLVTGSVVTDASTGKTASFGLAPPLARNQKFLFTGCSGYRGVGFRHSPDAYGGGYPTDALAQDHAIAATNDGHAGSPGGYDNDASWALTAPGVPDTDAVTDHFHRAVYTVTAATSPLHGLNRAGFPGELVT